MLLAIKSAFYLEYYMCHKFKVNYSSFDRSYLLIIIKEQSDIKIKRNTI